MASFIEFPIFTGVAGELRPWISWLEAFFVREKFTKLEKMNLAQSLLEGEAEAWFYIIQKTLIFYSWNELKDKLLLRFGDFADPDRIRLIAEQDRFLQEIRNEARIRRLKTTSISEKDLIRETETEALVPTDTIPVMNWTESRKSSSAQESISSPATIHETVPVSKFSTQKVDEISGEKKDESHEATLVKVLDNLEEASVTQNQVPVSKLEPSLQIPKDSPNVCENSQAVVGCEHQRSFQKNIRMDVVNGVVERSQRVMSITKNVSAHQVLDKTSAHKERLKPKSKRKLSLSLKTWRFKFKHTSKKRKFLDVKFFPVEEIVAGCEKKLFDRFQTSPSYALDVVNKTSKHWETHTPFTSTPVASVNSLSFAVDNFELCVGHDKDIMRLKLLLHSGCDGEKLPELDFHFGVNHGLLVFPWNLMFLGCGGLVFDRGKTNIISGSVIILKRDDQTMLVVKAKDAHGDSLIVRIKVILSCGVALGKQLQWAEIQKLSLYKELWIEIMDGDITKLLNSNGGKLQLYGSVLEVTCVQRLRVHQQHQKSKSTKSWRFKYKSSLRNTRSESRELKQFVGFMKFQLKHKWRSKHLHTISALGFYLSSVFSTVDSANSGRLQGLLEQVVQRDDEAYTKILDKLQLNLKQGLDVHGASGLRLFLRQQTFSSIWHRWRRKDWDLKVQLRKRDLMVAYSLRLSPGSKTHDSSENSWMFSKGFVSLFPTFKLEDKLIFGEGSIDTLHQAYKRKKRMTAQHSKSSSLGKTLFQSAGLPLKSQELI